MRLNAFASYRSAWQFAPVGDVFRELYAKQRAVYAPALEQIGVPAKLFAVPYKNNALPGVFIQSARRDAPVVLVVGGSDTGFGEIFFTAGRTLWEYGYSVAMVDLPGQGLTMDDGYHWEADTEKPVAAIVDVLVSRFKAVPGRIAMLGYSLGGYFASRTAGYEPRLGAVIATTPIWKPAQVIGTMEKARQAAKSVSTASRRNEEVFFWKAGAKDREEFVAKMSAWAQLEPSRVTVPFLSIAGTGEAALLVQQARDWHAAIGSNRKDLVILDSATGADAHVQANNRRRLSQEVAGWLSTIFRI